MPSRPSRRVNQTPTTTRPAASGASQTMRVAVPTTRENVTLPDRVSFMIIKNVGATTVIFRLNATSGNFWTLLPNEVSPKMLIDKGTLEVQAVTSASAVEIIFEG